VYYYSSSLEGDRKRVISFVILDEQTGKVLHKTTARSSKEFDRIPMLQQSYLIEDRMITVPNASHTNVALRLWKVDPNDVRPMCAEWKPPHPGTTAYNVFMEFPYVDGRIFMRAQDGTVRCYDLRAARP